MLLSFVSKILDCFSYIRHESGSTSSPGSSGTGGGAKTEPSDDDGMEHEAEEDASTKARKKLGLPAYDPDSSLVDAMPSILPLSEISTSCI